MRKNKGKAVFEIMLLVLSVVAFSYLIGETFTNVTAQEQAPPIGVPEEPEPSQTDINFLIEQGYLDPEDINNPEAVRAAAQRLQQSYDAGINTAVNDGRISIEFAQILNFFFQNPNLPFFNFINGGQAQQQLMDQTGGVHVCPISNEGKICQQYFGNECRASCQEECIPTDLANLPEDSKCVLGTCYDEREGICSPRSPKEKCEVNGDWFEEPIENLDICRQGCCILEGEAQFTTERGCTKLVNDNGLEFGDNVKFDGSIVEESICFAQVKLHKEGACLTPSFDNPGKNECKFVSESECNEIIGEFHENKLCSNPELNTVCERQDTTSCIESLDELYWTDSCGNKENIYDADKDKSWNNGLRLQKDEGCQLGDSSSPVANQGSCGNCNRLKSNYCGEKTDSEKLSNAEHDGGFVCRDMGCIDILGIRREHGESWCAYQSSIGLPGPDIPGLDSLTTAIPNNPLSGLIGGARSTDTPGSSHFRTSCLNGEITTENCGDHRNGICTQQLTPKDGGGVFAQAVCRTNRWAECLNYNPDNMEGRLYGMAGSRAGDLLALRLGLTCGQDPDCFVKKIDLTSSDDDTFKFSYCAPRYPPGLDLKDNLESSEEYCAVASNTCTAVFVKEARAFGAGGIEWKCKLNCDCVDGDDPDSAKPSQKFVQEMNDLCTSLGDCGTKVNYIGVPGGGKGFDVWTGENNGLARFTSGFDFGSFVLPHFEDANPFPGEFIFASADLINKIGDSDVGVGNFFGDFGGDFIEQLDRLISGLASGGNLDVDGGADTGSLYAFAGATGGVGTVLGAVGAALPASAAGSDIVAVYTTTSGEIAIQTLGTESVESLSNFFGSDIAGRTLTLPDGTVATFAQPGPNTVGTAIQGFAGATIGAAAGLAFTGFLIDVTGIGPGLDTVTTVGLATTGAIGGAHIGLGIADFGLGFTAGGAWAPCIYPAGCIMVAAVVIAIIILSIFEVGEQKEVKVNFECKAWERPAIALCEICGLDLMSDGRTTFPCNKYACESLGQNCVFAEDSEGPEAEGNNLCISVVPRDVSAPRIISTRDDVLSEGFSYENFEAGRGFRVKKNDEDGCIDQFERVTFGFDLDEHGKCRVSANSETNFDDMALFGRLSKNQVYTFSSTMLENLGFSGSLTPESNNEISLYIACEDYLKNKDERRPPHIVNICVAPRDLTATQIIIIPPEFLPYLSQEHELTINVNEPTECRWDNEDKSFFDMPIENRFRCNFDNELSGGFQCRANIPIQTSETNICVRCLDHPEWEGTPDEGYRNPNTQCRPTNIIRTQTPLQIDSVAPENGAIIKRGTPTIAITFEVETSGGVNNGEAICTYSVLNREAGLMIETNGKTHKQELNRLVAGEYSVTANCKDGAGNTAEKTTNFKIEVDNIIPKITRVYLDDGNLVVVTDEEAECGYSFSGCDFRVEQGNLMSIVSNSARKRHSTNFESGKTYHIKCKDDFGNENLGCGIIATEGVLGSV